MMVPPSGQNAVCVIAVTSLVLIECGRHLIQPATRTPAPTTSASAITVALNIFTRLLAEGREHRHAPVHWEPTRQYLQMLVVDYSGKQTYEYLT